MALLVLPYLPSSPPNLSSGSGVDVDVDVDTMSKARIEKGDGSQSLQHTQPKMLPEHHDDGGQRDAGDGIRTATAHSSAFFGPEINYQIATPPRPAPEPNPRIKPCTPTTAPLEGHSCSSIDGNSVVPGSSDNEMDHTQWQELLLNACPSSPEPSKGHESVLLPPLTHPNGISMFPGMSALEQENMSREALSQAEASIIADSIGPHIRDDATDGGYDSDRFSSASTTAESCVRDYMYENGRRYHRFREGSYNFPNDDVEQEREDMKHAMVKLLCNQKLHFAPIGSHPQEILDIGTGTGIWPIEMGDLYPSAQVMGIDLSPIQPDWLPPNVRFLVDDVESPWLHPRNHFDYIHARNTVMAIRDWAQLFQRSIEHLKPGGWMELQEIHHRPKSAQSDNIVSPEHPVAQFWTRVTEGLNELGVDFDASADGRLANQMEEAGLINVTERVFHVPIGTWPKNKVLKTVGLYWRTILLDGLQAIALGPLTRGLRWNREQVEVFLIDVRRAYYDNHVLMYMPLHIVYGQKAP